MLEPCCTPSRPTRWGHHVNSSRPARHATTVFTALGALGIRLFDESATVWDYYRGRELPDANKVSATDILELGKLSTALRQQLAVSKSIHDTVMKSKRARGRKVRFEFNA